MSSFPSYVDLEFTARCNLKCGFCFGPADDGGRTPNLDVDFWKRVMDGICRRGCIGIVVSGGEPTLYPHLKELLSYAKHLGLQTVLSTHGRHEARLLAVAANCDWIALPVDAVSKKFLVQLRGDEWGLVCATALATTLKLKTAERVKIKIGSVATRLNCNEIVELANCLAGMPSLPFDSWKIYQYTPRRKFSDRREIYEISDTEFRTLSDRVEATGVSRCINTVFSSHLRRRRAYLFVYPDGTVAIPNEGENFSDIVVGNLMSEGDAALDRVDAYELFSNEQNFEVTYG